MLVHTSTVITSEYLSFSLNPSIYRTPVFNSSLIVAETQLRDHLTWSFERPKLKGFYPEKRGKKHTIPAQHYLKNIEYIINHHHTIPYI